jgi:son of sevenless-like protein
VFLFYIVSVLIMNLYDSTGSSFALADMMFNTTFLMTYRTFTTSAQLFDLLVKRYLIEPPEGLADQNTWAWEEKKKFIRIRLVICKASLCPKCFADDDRAPRAFRVINVFKLWIENHLYDDDEAAVLRAIGRFAETSVMENDPVQGEQLKRTADRRVRRFYIGTCCPSAAADCYDSETLG